jgi:hypothetical protein
MIGIIVSCAMLMKINKDMFEKSGAPDMDFQREGARFMGVLMLGVCVALWSGCDGDSGSEEEQVVGYYQIADNEVPEEIEMDVPPPPPEPEPEKIAAKEDPNAGPVSLVDQENMDETAEEIQQDFDDGLDEANDALQAFVEEFGRFPKSMGELLRAGELAMSPRLPSGKKMSFNRETRKFFFEDK